MARQCYQIPITWRREGPREVYVRPEGSTCTAAKVEVYRGYIGGKIVAFVAVWYDGEKRWWNQRFSGRRLESQLPTFLREIQEEHGYQLLATAV